MNPKKVIGGVLIVLGLLFRAISLAHFNQKAKTLPDTPVARRRFAQSRRNALLIDGGFIAFGFYVLLTP